MVSSREVDSIKDKMANAMFCQCIFSLHSFVNNMIPMQSVPMAIQRVFIEVGFEK